MDVLGDTHELALVSTVKSFQNLLDSQRELFYGQVDQLQRLVVAQCKLTGINPLSQEMAAGALSIKIGKRPRDLLNPKSIKYMQSVFSIKDTISKKECREISSLFGIKVMQVRDFFASQRTRVRKFVRMSREKAIRPNACANLQAGDDMISDTTVPCDAVPLKTVSPVSTCKIPSFLTCNGEQEGTADCDKYFADNIFNLMRKEETFSGQVKLVESILKIQNSSVLQCFLSKGVLMILASWLNAASLDEQTTVLLAILKVLCHLPLHKAIPAHVSIILQSVNKLRFYRTSEISNRARILLSRWSKIFAQSQVSGGPKEKKSFGDSPDEILLKQSIGEIMNDKSLRDGTSLCDEVIVSPQDGSGNIRIMEPQRMLKLLPSSSNDPKRNHFSPLNQFRERRKVQLLENPSDKVPTRAVQSSTIHNRPISADEIQKAKLRAQWMRNKNGSDRSDPKVSIGISSEKSSIPTEIASTRYSKFGRIGMVKDPTRGCDPKVLGGISSKKSSIPIDTATVSKSGKIEGVKVPTRGCEKVNIPNLNGGYENCGTLMLSAKHEAFMDIRQKSVVKESSINKCRSVHVTWKIPPVIKMKDVWKVGAGENSKEVGVQMSRTKRERETMYETGAHIPAEPREPWDVELDCDDSLTPHVPIEPLPDADVPSVSTSSTDIIDQEPDMELLEVLLNNPELVFALTSGDGRSLSEEERVRVLDMIKTKAKEDVRVEVSLPSPTPPNNPTPNGWMSRRLPMPAMDWHPRPQQFVPVIPREEKRPTPLFDSRLRHLPAPRGSSNRWRQITPAYPQQRYRNATWHDYRWRR